MTIATGVLEMKTVNVLSSTRRGEWDGFLSASPDSTFYHTYEWTEILRIGAGIVPSFWGLWLDGELSVIWPCFVIPAFGGKLLYSPSTDGAPLVKSGVKLDCLNDIVQYAFATARKQGVLHWSFDVPTKSYFVNLAPGLGFESSSSPRCTYNVDTALPSETLWKRLASVTRTAVRQARKNSLEIKSSSEHDEFAAFFSIYQSTMRRRQLTALRDPGSLATWLMRLTEEGKTKLFVATYRGDIVAGVLLLLYKKRAHWWLGASLPDSWKLRPNELLMWNVIEWASNFGYYNLELGGTPSRETHGLNTFKRHLGGERVELVRFTLPVNHLKDQLSTSLVGMYRKVKQHGLVPQFFTDRVLKRRNAWFD